MTKICRPIPRIVKVLRHTQAFVILEKCCLRVHIRYNKRRTCREDTGFRQQIYKYTDSSK